MELGIISGRAGQHLASVIAEHLSVESVSCAVDRFPDGELRPVVPDLRGDDIYVVAPTGPPVNDSLVELLLILDACRRARAGRLTAVVPYYGYARQDRRDQVGEAIGARMAADVIAAAGADRLVVVDPHSTALESMFGIGVETLTAVPVLVTALSGSLPDETVVIAPDLGAVKLAERVATELESPVAVVRKTRVSGTSVRTTGLVGDVADRPVLLVDDMISTGATLAAAAKAALAHGALPDITVIATHALLVGNATDRLGNPPIRRIVVTDTVSVPAQRPSSLTVRSIGPLLADAVRRMHDGESLAEISLYATDTKPSGPR